MILKEPYSLLLRPFAFLYGLGVALRNMAFEHGVLRSETYPIPIICVGNITVGGTGKTPHVEYILSKLLPHYRVAVLSRGYRRKSRGQVIASEHTLIAEIGDEPRQLKLKYPDIILVVDGNRRRSMDYLMSLPKDERPDVVIMDDGLQHRYVKPSYSILLVDSTRPLQEDKLLPEGRLREPASARYRVDCIIATKCPETLRPIEQRLIERTLAAYPHQEVFFTKIRYKGLYKISELGTNAFPTSIDLERGSPVIALSGIANPTLFIDYLTERYKVVEQLLFADHHNFEKGDFETIINAFQRHLTEYPNLSIITTEKDAVRLVESFERFPENMREHIHYLPIEVAVLQREDALERQLRLAVRAKPKSLQNID